MSRHLAISVQRLGKRYELAPDAGASRAPRATTLGEALAAGVRGGFRGLFSRRRPEAFWAVDDVSFDVHRGEVVGVIGRNGAGKSTVLKMLSRITPPTRGRVELHGRVGSLLEVGTGFHPELTGRENIFMNGAILGMRRSEIQRQFDAIVDFAGVERFLDTPVKRYSSGMYVRLAFAVAAHLDPDILIVDEVLAVGDAAFQAKCMGKMKDVSACGRTVLFVSHNMQAISTLTRRCVVLAHGRVAFDGPTEPAIAAYLREGAGDGLTYAAPPHPTEPRVTRLALRTSLPENTQHNGAPMAFEVDVTAPGPVDGASFAIQAVNQQTQAPTMYVWTFDSERPMCRQGGTYRLTCVIPQLRLFMGRYHLVVHLAERAGGRLFQVIDGICPFEVVMYGRPREYDWIPGTCTYLEECVWQIERVAASAASHADPQVA